MERPNWDKSQIVDCGENGELIFCEDNFNFLVRSWITDEVGNENLNVVSFLGPEASGKSFFTNVLCEYLKTYGKMSWTRSMKTSGLKGFSYGEAFIQEKTQRKCLHTTKVGIYAYPELFQIQMDKTKTYFCIIHVNCKRAENPEERLLEDALNMLAAIVSSKIVNIVYNNKSVMQHLRQQIFLPNFGMIRERLCENVVHLNRYVEAGHVTNFHGTNELQIDIETTESLHDEHGRVSFNENQIAAVSILMKSITSQRSDPSQLLEANLLINIQNLGECFKTSTSLLNMCIKCTGLSGEKVGSLNTQDDIAAKHFLEYLLEEQKNGTSKKSSDDPNKTDKNKLEDHENPEKQPTFNSLAIETSVPGADNDLTTWMFLNSKTNDDADKDSDAYKIKLFIQSTAEKHQQAYRKHLKSVIQSDNFQVADLRKKHKEIVKILKTQFKNDMRGNINEKYDVKTLWKMEMHSQLEKIYTICQDIKLGQMVSTGEQSTSHTNVRTKNHKSNSLERKDYIIFYISHDFLGMSLNLEGNPVVFSDGKNYVSIPMIVGQTKQGNFCFGNEVNLQEVLQRLRIKWNVGQILEIGHFDVENVVVDSTKISLNVEFLLSYLLNELKKEALATASLKLLPTCIVCVPYCYTSKQRQQIVDAAKIAQFRSVELLNEMSVLAYEYAHCLREYPKNGLFLVTTESTKNFQDIALYFCVADLKNPGNSRHHRVRMVSHAGSYHEQNVTVLDSFLSALKKIKFLFEKDMDRETRERVDEPFYLIRSTIARYHDELLHKDCATRNWCIDDILVNVFKNVIVLNRTNYWDPMKTYIHAISGVPVESASIATIFNGIKRFISNHEKVVDLLASPLWLLGKDKEMALNKGISLTTVPRTFCVYSQSNSTIFLQKLSPTSNFEIMKIDTKLEVGWSAFSKQKKILCIHFGIKNDGIVYLIKVDMMHTDPDDEIKNLTEGTDYEVTGMLHGEKVNECKKHLPLIKGVHT